MKLFLIMIPLLVLSGCIFSSTPPEGTMNLTWGYNQTFIINGLGTYQWYVNDAAVTGETRTDFTFKSLGYGLGTYEIKVKSKFSAFSGERVWTVIVKSPPSTVPSATGCDDIESAGLVCTLEQNCN